MPYRLVHGMLQSYIPQIPTVTDSSNYKLHQQIQKHFLSFLGAIPILTLDFVGVRL